MADETNDLITATAVMAVGGMADAESTIIADMITRASHTANTKTNRLLKARALTEYYNGDGSISLITKQRPINSVAGLYQDAGREFSADSLVDSDLYSIMSDEGQIIATGTVFYRGIQIIKLVYNAGYSTVPADLEEAVLELVLYWYEMQYKNKSVGVSSRGGDGRTVTYHKEIPSHVQDIFWHYYKYWSG